MYWLAYPPPSTYSRYRFSPTFPPGPKQSQTKPQSFNVNQAAMVIHTELAVQAPALGTCERITTTLKGYITFSVAGCKWVKPKVEDGAAFERLYTLKGGVIGRGGFAMVYSGVRKQDQLPVAIKEIHRARRFKTAKDGETPLEVALMQEVAGVPGVVKLLDYFDMVESYYVVMERLTNSKDLFDFISEEGPLPETLGRHIFRQVIETVLQCHARGVLHRDIKDENILIDVNTHQIKLIDFGSGTYLHDGVYTDFEGTRVYSPPEWIKFRRYKADGLTVWSLGILLYDMLCGDVPYETDDEIRESDLVWRPNIPVSREARSLVEKCLQPDPEDRISLSAILDDPWMSLTPETRPIEVKLHSTSGPLLPTRPVSL